MTSAAIPNDQQLPHLAMALDANRMARLFESLRPEFHLRQCEITYVRYKPKTSCIVLYSVHHVAGSTWIYAKLFAEDAAGRVADGDARAVYLPEYRMAVLWFPSDLQMPAMRLTATREQSRELLLRAAAQAKRGRFERFSGEWIPVRYKPERRCVMSGIYEKGAPRRFYARFYAGTSGARTSDSHRHFASLAPFGIQVPRRIGYSSRYRVLLTKELAGEPLIRWLTGSNWEAFAGAEAAGIMLAELQHLPPPAGLPDIADRPRQLAAAARIIDYLLPGGEGGSIAGLLIRSFSRPEHTTLLHGDFYYDQVLVHDGAGRLIDLDELGIGDPVQDPANFCAHLQALVIRGEMDVSRAERIRGRFLDSYFGASGLRVRQETLAWHFAASLLELSVQPFRRFENQWPRKMGVLIRSAQYAFEEQRVCFYRC